MPQHDSFSTELLAHSFLVCISEEMGMVLALKFKTALILSLKKDNKKKSHQIFKVFTGVSFDYEGKVKSASDSQVILTTTV